MSDKSKDPEYFFCNLNNSPIPTIKIKGKVSEAYPSEKPVKSAKVVVNVGNGIERMSLSKNDGTFEIDTRIKEADYSGKTSDFRVSKKGYTKLTENKSWGNPTVTQDFSLTKELNFSDRLLRVTKGKVNISSGIPSDTYIRITPSSYQTDGDWRGLRRKVNSNGNWGTSNCWVRSDVDRTLFSSSGAPFQFAVFIDSNGNKLWDESETRICGSEDATWNSWRNVNCNGTNNDDARGTIYYNNKSYTVKQAKSYISQGGEVQIFLSTDKDNVHAEGGLQLNLSNFNNNQEFRNALINAGNNGLYISTSNLSWFGFLVSAMTESSFGFEHVNLSGSLKLTWRSDNDTFNIEQNGATLEVNGENLNFDSTIVLWTNVDYRN